MPEQDQSRAKTQLKGRAKEQEEKAKDGAMKTKRNPFAHEKVR